MPRALPPVLSIALTTPAVLAGAPDLPPPPETTRLAVTDTYHGVAVRDPYRWLEDWSDPDVRAWSDAQNTYARAALDALPSRPAIEARLTELLSAPVTRWGDLHGAGGKLFAIINKPPKQQPYLAVLDSADAPETERTLVDPETFEPPKGLRDETAGAYAIDWFVPSPDGSLVAVSLSKGGSESGDLFLFDTATGEPTGTVIEGVNGGTAGGSLAWTPEGDAFYYTRYPRAGERPESDMAFFVDVYRHTLGDPVSEDAYEIGREFPKIGEIELKCDHNSGRVICTVQDGDGGEFAHFVRQVSGPDAGTWTRISDYKEGIKQAYFGEAGEIFLISRAGAPRGEILKVRATSPALANATRVIPESDDTIVSNFWGPPSLLATDGRLLIEYQTGGPSEIRVFDRAGKPLPSPNLPPVSSIGQMVETDDGVLFSVGSFTQQTGWKRLDPRTGKVTDTALHSDPPADLSHITVVREFATSKDGTQIPINIMIPEGVTRDGNNPTILYGYGGYGINLTPGYRAYRADLLEQGVIYAVANIRGGGEYGAEWHLGGNLTNKQNVFDDFQAAAEHLIERGFTNPDRLAIMGGSNGGLLMGATLTQRPGLARTVVSYVGIYDMLRVELSANGVFNIPEFGTVQDPDQFRALYAYSPYHNVEPGTDYPAVLFLTGANDPRVDPMQSRKMTAMLQDATRTLDHPNPVLLRTSMDTGHGGGTPLDEQIRQAVDVHAFLYHRLGVDYTPTHD
jgi:prolyl oligopeptidase